MCAFRNLEEANQLRKSVCVAIMKWCSRRGYSRICGRWKPSAYVVASVTTNVNLLLFNYSIRIRKIRTDVNNILCYGYLKISAMHKSFYVLILYKLRIKNRIKLLDVEMKFS